VDFFEDGSDLTWEYEHHHGIVEHKPGIVGLKDDPTAQNSLQEQQKYYKYLRKVVLELKKLSQMIKKRLQLVNVV